MKNTFRDFVLNEALEGEPSNARPMWENGADCGYRGLTYNEDILNLFAEYETEIEDIIENTLDTKPYIAFAKWCEKRGAFGGRVDFACFMVWAAAEQIAFDIMVAVEQKEETI